MYCGICVHKIREYIKIWLLVFVESNIIFYYHIIFFHVVILYLDFKCFHWHSRRRAISTSIETLVHAIITKFYIILF
jgi:hypothetical protein